MMVQFEVKPQISKADPMSFDSCLAAFSDAAPNNATVQRLREYRSSVEDVAPGASNMGEHFQGLISASMSFHDRENPRYSIKKFLDDVLGDRMYVPLNVNAHHASIAIALYAGDGIVAKITEQSYLSSALRPYDGVSTTLPLVLPPIMTRKEAGYFLEIFPWVDQREITRKDLNEMHKSLDRHGMQFSAGDDRMDNLGKLSNGKVVILDGDAVSMVKDWEVPAEKRTVAISEWRQELDQCFPGLYGDFDNPEDYDLKKFLRNPPDYEYRYASPA